jgi:hypothetical protein
LKSFLLCCYNSIIRGRKQKGERKMTRETFNMYQSIIAFENGELDQDEVVELFQILLDTGFILNLQGSYHRIARDLIDEGLVEVR